MPEEVSEVQSATRSLQMQHEVALEFRDRLSLSQEKVLAGKPGQHRIDHEFFTVLEKVGRIHNDCRVLLSAGHQRAALGTMDRMTEAQRCRRLPWTGCTGGPSLQ